MCSRHSNVKKKLILYIIILLWYIIKYVLYNKNNFLDQNIVVIYMERLCSKHPSFSRGTLHWNLWKFGKKKKGGTAHQESYQFCFFLFSKRSDKCLFEGKLSVIIHMQVTLPNLFIILLITHKKIQLNSRVTVERAILPEERTAA